MFSFPDLATKASLKDKKSAEYERKKRKSSQEQTNKDEGASEEPATPAESGSKKRRGRQRKMEATTPYRLVARMDTNNGNDGSIPLRNYYSLSCTRAVLITEQQNN